MSGTLMRMRWMLAAAVVASLACGGGGASTAGSASVSPAPSASAVAAGGLSAVRTLGAVKFADRGTASVAGKSELAVAIEDFAFMPTFVQGTAGQRVMLQLTNDTSTPHNLSIPAQQIDHAVPAKSKGSIEVTIPQSGVLLFFCKFHTGSGMNGQLITGAGAPAVVDAPTEPAATTPRTTPAAGTGEVGY